MKFVNSLTLWILKNNFLYLRMLIWILLIALEAWVVLYSIRAIWRWLNRS